VLFAAKPRPVPTAAPRDPQAAPFAELPLELNAVVAEFSLPLARLSGLKCGDTIPLVLSREVPLKILETTIAYGSVGAADERAALQLTRVF
jgi:flagellar motor switch protein FliM